MEFVPLLVEESAIPSLYLKCMCALLLCVLVWLHCNGHLFFCCISDKTAAQGVFAALGILGPVVLKHSHTYPQFPRGIFKSTRTAVFRIITLTEDVADEIL